MEIQNAVKMIKQEFNENLNSHVFLIETNNYDECLKDIKELIKDITNANEASKIQIDDENYIELTIIRPDGKDIKKDQIFGLQERLKTKPIISDYMIYIIIGADKMNDTAANKLLKTIEEPGENIIGFMLAENIDLILPTIKSRCEIQTILYDDKTTTSEIDLKEIDSVTTSLIEMIENNNLVKYNIIKNENKIIKENGKLVANQIKDYYNTACNISKGINLNNDTLNLIEKNNSNRQLIEKAKYLNKTLNKLTLNMNMDLLLEKIFIELKEVKNRWQ